MRAAASYWRSVPVKSIVVFLLGVFLLFSTTGFASDIGDMGRQTRLRFLLSVLVSGLFPVGYAFLGFRLRKQWWKGIVPLSVVHFFVMLLLTNALPILPQATQFGSAEISALDRRLTQDGLAIMAAVALGYACFLYVSITEFRRYFRVHAEMELALGADEEIFFEVFAENDGAT